MGGDGLRTLISDLFKGTVHIKRKIEEVGTDTIDRQILNVEQESMLNIRSKIFLITISYVFTSFVRYIFEKITKGFLWNISFKSSYLAK